MASLFDAVERPRVIINTNDFNKPKSLADAIEKPIAEVPSEGVPEHHTSRLQSVMDKLFGLHGQERYQLWPEKLVRDAISAPHDVMTEGLLPPGLRREDFTDIPASTEPTTAVGKALGLAPTAWQPNDNAVEKAQAVSALAGTGGLAGAGNEAGVALGVVPVDVAKKLNFKSSPVSDVLKQAVGNTPSASIDADGHLVLKVLRNQLPDQEMVESVRGGVFYLPEGSKYARYYNGTTNNNYGGRQAIEGETAFKNPLVVRGQTGGKAPENAYNQLMGDKKAYKNLEADVMQVINASWMRNKDLQAYYDLVNRYLDKHAPEMKNYADYILANSSKGNQLKYALQEAAIASAARKAGHDGIIGYSEGRGSNKGKPFLSEIFDVRENKYPSPDGDFSVHPELYSDSSKPGMAIQAMANTNKPFYSAVENAVAAAKQPKADAQQWLSFLKNQPGVKQEELAHLGLDKLSGSITKDELLKAVQEGQPQIKEVVKGAKSWDNLTSQERDKMAMKYGDETGSIPSDTELKNWYNQNQKSDTKYHSYQLPGGENYREMLLTLPDKQQRLYEWEYFDPKTQTSKQFKTEAEAKAAAPEGAVVNQKEVAELNPAYRSSHWDEPNVLAHIRMNDRNIDGKKSLHLEEIQSDWHQAGRKQGYKQDNKNKLSVKNEGGIWRVRDENGQRVDLNGAAGFTTEEGARNAIANNTRDIGGVPDAPFKKTWDELALKKAITHAVKNGYDSISWTPGEAQAARYDLSKQVNLVSANKQPNGKYLTYIEGKDEGPLFRNRDGFSDNGQKEMTAQELEATIGKEAAEKIINGKPNKEGWIDLRDKDLKVGGQGMKAFYDKMLVDKMNALVKKHGGKVEKAEIPLDTKKPTDFKDFADWEKAKAEGRKQLVHVLKITPELREHVLKKGFPLFSAGVPVFNPVNHNPFEEKK